MWAETYSGSIAFEAKSRSTYADGTFTTANDAGNGYALAVADLSGLDNIASATSVTLEFDVVISGRLIIGIGDKNTRGTNANGSSKTTYNTDGIIMRYGTTDGTYVRVNGGTNNSNLMSASSHVLFILDRVNGKYSYTITYHDGESVTQTGLSGTNISTSVSNATIVEAYSWASNQSNALSSVSYSYEYTASSFDYTVKAVSAGGDELKTIASGTSTEAVTVSYPRAFQIDDVWYTCPSTNNFSVEATSLNPNPTITYTADESIIYFKEAEAITSSQNMSSASCSGGTYVDYYAGPTSVSISETGVYELETNVVSRNSKSSLEVYPAEGTASIAQIAKNGSLGIRTCFFNALAGTTVRVGGPYYTEKFQNSLGFDYVLIRRTGDLSVSATIGSTGYTTFASAYPLDLTNLPYGLTAYYVASDAIGDNTVTLTAKSDEAVAAGTGLILAGTASTPYNIPVVASGTDISASNLLVGCTSEMALTTNANLYVLVNNGGTAEFQSLKTHGATIPAGKAYLNAGTSEAGALKIVFADQEETGIETVQVSEPEANGYYNLAGQRVAKATKGLYIVNGKKVIMK